MDEEEAIGIGGLEGGKIKDCVLVKGTGMQLQLVLEFEDVMVLFDAYVYIVPLYDFLSIFMSI